MYFKISPVTPDPHFSWIIAKNPASKFERDLSNHADMRVVRGEFSQDGSYCGSVTNDPLSFMLVQREHNDANYLDATLHCVCPANLAGFATVFRSALLGVNPSKAVLTDEEFLAPKLFEAEVGPFPTGSRHAVQVFAEVNMTSTPLDEGTSLSFTLRVANNASCSTTEFLQKLYVVSYYLTRRYGYEVVTDDQVTKFVRLSSGWLSKMRSQDHVIKELCGFKRDKSEAFRSALLGSSLEGDQQSEEPETHAEREPSLHERRHALIVEILSEHVIPGARIIDYGCAEGSLLRKLSSPLSAMRLLGVDADVYRAKQKLKKARVPYDQCSFLQGNLLYPELADEWLRPDALILTEVIEHLEEEDRGKLLDVICDDICPRVVVLTTPNVTYNPVWDIPAGQYRHRDHRIEYTAEQFESEVISRLSTNYDVTLLDLIPGSEVQPSFVLKAVRKTPANLGRRPVRIYSPFRLDAAGYEVSSHELRTGTCSSPFLKNARDIFYLGPTMSPVGYDPGYSEYLEHPVAAFEYYKSRGVSQLVAEPKYMGSRAYILLLRDPEMAKQVGVSGPCVVNSRSGVRFFDADDPSVERIYAELQPKMTTDLMILDAEIMPWSLKAQGLIDRQFVVPGETALLARKRSEDKWANASAYLDTLKKFTAPGPLEVRPFHVLAQANLSKRGAWQDVQLGFYQDHYQQLNTIENLSGEIVRSYAWGYVDLSSENSMRYSVNAWHQFCKVGEGFVYKPAQGMVMRKPDGHLHQPALKVRGQDYLRLIYGIDYLEEGWFDRLKSRNMRRKRALAVQEQELGERMLLAFMRGDQEARLAYVAAFLGVEGVNMRGIDRTL